MNEGSPYRNIDSELVEFVKLVREHGLIVDQAVLGSTPEEPCRMIFQSVADGVEFLEQTAHANDYVLGSNIALTILPPLGVTRPRSQVAWLPEITPMITAAWEKKDS